MTCQEALSLLYDIIDKEASEIDAQQVRQHLANCKDCSEVYRVEATINELVKERISQTNGPSDRFQALKSKVLAELDAIDAEERSGSRADASIAPTKKKPTFRLNRMLAVAAAAVVVFFGAFYATQYTDHQHVYLPLEEAHWAGAEDTSEFRNVSVTASTESQLQGEWAYHIDHTVAGFNLVGGHLDTIDGVEFAHFMYESGERR
ncbi:MAG: zf-HC2 domain-containing protein, partial [candidate division Zixibacteria bacterium]|nr:zf-HC2 domain-containing protein [candidate division Zixibacteria bacterium]